VKMGRSSPPTSPATICTPRSKHQTTAVLSQRLRVVHTELRGDLGSLRLRGRPVAGRAVLSIEALSINRAHGTASASGAPPGAVSPRVLPIGREPPPEFSAPRRVPPPFPDEAAQS
jgi:hypothetical protein